MRGSGTTLTNRGPISGAGGLSKTGDGRLVLSDIPNTYTWSTRARWPWLVLVLFFYPIGLPSAFAAADSPHPIPSKHLPTEREREMTYYSARQAFGRLSLYLAKEKRPLPQGIWLALPERTAIYSIGESGLGGIVGGWVFDYLDADGQRNEARLNCWGEIQVTPRTTDPGKRIPSLIRPTEWVLDNTDAHTLALSSSAIANSGRFGGCLMMAEVTERGTRPVWAGGAWRATDRRRFGTGHFSDEKHQFCNLEFSDSQNLHRICFTCLEYSTF